MAKREYKTDGLTVLWDSDLCTHCEKCWRGLPAVFRPEERPWIVLPMAPREEIVRQVGECPSGALRIGKPKASVKCERCDGDGKAHGSDRPFEYSGPNSYPGKCPVCNGSGSV